MSLSLASRASLRCSATLAVSRRLLSSGGSGSTSSTSHATPSTSTLTTSPALESSTSTSSPIPDDSSEVPSSAEEPVKRLSWAEKDALLKQTMLERDGGQSTLSTENGEWNGLRTHVKNNMFRVI